MLASKITDILEKAPDGSNPFSFMFQFLLRAEKPRSPEYFRPFLTMVAAVYGLVCICCALIVILPLFQGSEGRARNCWILKRRYLGQHEYPYLILNNGLVIAISYLLTGVLFEFFLSLQLNTLSSESALKVHRFSWIEILKLPSQCAIFIQAFTMLFISASDPSADGLGRYFLPPMVFNTLLIGFPLIAAVSSVFLTAQKARAVEKQDNSYLYLSEVLADAISRWEDGQHILSQEQKDLLQSAYSTYLHDSINKLQSRLRIGLFWSFMGVPSILFYFGGISALIATVYRPVEADIKVGSGYKIQRQESNATTGSSESKDTKIFSGKTSLEESSKLSKGSPRRLSRSLRFLWGHYLLMSVALSFDVTTGLVFYLNPNNFKDVKQAEKFFVTNLSGSVLILLGIIILLVRISTDGKPSKNSDEKPSGRIEQKKCTV